MTEKKPPVRARSKRRGKPPKKAGGTPYDDELIGIHLDAYEGSSTVKSICEYLGISSRAYYNWYRDNPRFRERVRQIRASADDQVEAALFKRAVGFEHEEVTVTQETGGHDGAKEKIATKSVYVVPDVGAAKHWLSMRRPEDWKDVKQVQVNVEWADRIKRAAQKLDLDPSEYEDVTEGENHDTQD